MDETKTPLSVARYYAQELLGIPEGEDNDRQLEARMDLIAYAFLSIAESLSVLALAAENYIQG